MHRRQRQPARIVEERARIEVGTFAAGGALKPFADERRALDRRGKLGEPSLRDCAQLVDGSGGAPEQDADLGEGETGALGDVDHRERPDCGLGVAAASGDPWRSGEQPDRLVVADRRGGPAAQLGKPADRELRA